MNAFQVCFLGSDTRKGRDTAETLIFFLRRKCLGNFYSLQKIYILNGTIQVMLSPESLQSSKKNLSLIICKNAGYYLKPLSLFSERHESYCISETVYYLLKQNTTFST